jgi:iron complex outermembrane receptor protein
VGGTVTVPWGAGKFASGAEYGLEHIVSSNLGDHTRSHWSVQAEPTWNVTEKMSAGAVARLDDYSTFGEEWTGSLLFKRGLAEGEEVYVSLGRLIRVPTFTELYYSDPTTAGDSQLKPETAYSVEPGWPSASARPERRGGGFIRQEHDTIEFTKMTPSDPKFVARNISEAFTVGVNFTADGMPTGISAMTCAMPIRTRISTTGSHL